MDTTALSGINSSGAQATPASAAKPIAPVKATERSPSAGGHGSSLAKDTKHAARETPVSRSSSDETRPKEELEDKKAPPVEDSIIEIVADSFDKGTQLKVDRDDDTGRIIFQTVMKKTGEVVRQVPSEEMVALAKSMNMGKGLLVNKEA